MTAYDIPLSFGPLPATNERRFVWNSDEWWKWLKSYRRKPSIESIYTRLSGYDSFVSFHGARPLDVATFYESGIKLGDVEILNQRAKDIFLSDQYPKITPQIMETAIGAALLIDDQKLFAVIDENEISGHYLIYGSEHICGIAASMIPEVGFDCRQILKLFGTPTVFRIALPRHLIPDEQLRELAKYLVEVYWDERKSARPPKIDWSWILRLEIPGQYVLDHCHPEIISDPLLHYTPYRYRDNFPCDL